VTRAQRLRALLPAIWSLYWRAETRKAEADAYFLAVALGHPGSYGELLEMTAAKVFNEIEL
jgi:hypothetical protein